MEEQTLRTNLTNMLRLKSQDSSTYRKAETIYQSIISSTTDIPNFEQSIGNSNNTFALFIFGNVYKILIKENSTMKHSTDSMLLLINHTIPFLNINAIKGNGILANLQKKVFELIVSPGEEKTPLMIRLAVSILHHTLTNTDDIENNKQAKNILCSMFNIAVQSHRTNILSKQASKMLTHLLKDNSSLAKILSKSANMTMLANLDANLYLNNVREVIAEFPLQQINDIGYRVTKYLATKQCSSEADESYLAQIYYFLEKLMGKFTGSTLEQIIKQLVNNIPSSVESESKAIYCYLQTLHTGFEALVSMNERTANKYVSVVVSILQQFIIKGGRVEKQAIGIMKSIMSSGIRKSLWIYNTNQQQNVLNFVDSLEISEEKGNNFTKVTIMLQSMLSDQYRNHRGTAGILCCFFDSLDISAFDLTLELIDKIVNFRNNFEQRYFKSIMHSIFRSMSIKNICGVYPIGVKGDIGNEQFETFNNLWLVSCTEKYEGQENFATFMQFYYPLLIELKSIIATPNLSLIRKQAYKNLLQMFWRSLKVFCRKVSTKYNYQLLIQTIKGELTEANDSVLDHIAMALENLCSSLYQQQYECKWAGNLISLLAKILSLEKNSSKQILRAMKYLSVIADKQYLNRVFDKNISKLIEEKEKGTLCNSDNVSANTKNLQILIAVSNGINFYDPSVVAPYRISREELVVKLISDLIVQINFFQKKAYKYILETLPLMGKGYLMQTIELLQANHHKILPASKHYRMAILMYLWKKVSENEDDLGEMFEFIKKYLPQVLLDLRQSNQRTKKQATLLFDSFCGKLEEMGIIQNFMEIMCAGLATDSTQVKVATIHGLTAIYNKKIDVDIEFSIGILQIILMMLYQKKTQIYKAVVEFSRRFIFSIQKSKQVNHVLSTIIEQLFKADVISKMDNRSVLKHFLIKLAKKFGRQQIEKLIPIEDRKILTNAIKTENRQKRKKKEKQAFKRQQIENAKRQKANQESSDTENQYEEEEGGEMDEEQNEELKQLQNTDNLLLKYDLEKENFHFEEEKLNIKNNLKKANLEKRKEGDEISFNENGLMIIRQDPRRQRQAFNNDQEEDPQAQAFLNVKKKKKLDQVHEVKQSGATYSSKRAGGDVMIKNKPEPYAFIQFSSKALNKRFKKRAQKVFDTIFQRKQGGLKGIKSRISTKGH